MPQQLKDTLLQKRWLFVNAGGSGTWVHGQVSGGNYRIEQLAHFPGASLKILPILQHWLC